METTIKRSFMHADNVTFSFLFRTLPYMIILLNSKKASFK